MHVAVFRLPSNFLCLVLLLSTIGVPGPRSVKGAEGTAETGKKIQPAEVSAFLEQNCVSCHDASTQEGGLDLESQPLSTKALADPDEFYLWQRVFDRVREGEMPPDETLDADEKARFIDNLREHLKSFDADRIAKHGRVSARRLTRAQYERNVSDLLSVHVPLQVHLPADSLTSGFDTVSKSQQISHHLMAAYLRAADVALEAAFAQVFTEAPSQNLRLDWTDLRRDEWKTDREPEGRPEHKDIVSWSTRQSFYGRMSATTVTDSGRYRVRVRIQAVNPPNSGRVWCSFRSGVCSAKATTFYWIDSLEATAEPSEHEFEVWIRAGHKLQLRPNDRALRQAGAGRSVGEVGGPAGFVEKKGIPGVAIKWIEMERVDGVSKDDARGALIGDLQLKQVDEQGDDSSGQFGIASEDPQRDLKKLVHRFAQRAFRRPVESAELRPYLGLAEQRLVRGEPLREALRAAYRAILCSSRFLYFEESSGELDDHALATRLSHFLWGRSPDRKLRQLANAGRLSESDVLRDQTDRLLDDPKSQAFFEEFTDQWLMLYELNSTTPDAKLYPEYDDILHHSLAQETHAFVRELVREDLPVTNVVDSDFTFLNNRLARHYDIDWPGGTGLKRVSLASSDRRGGLITHASVMKVTANGTTTSPIVRGMWMLERIMGEHVPPPPANVPAVEPDIRGATSIRDQLDKHRQLESCATCHVKIDPPGFALESYDVIGGWRERYRAVSSEGKKRWMDGLPIDPSHTLHHGEHFDNIHELKRLLVAHPERLAHNLASHFATYATGAAPTFADRDVIDAMVEGAKEHDYGVRSLLHEVVQSRLFRNK